MLRRYGLASVALASLLLGGCPTKDNPLYGLTQGGSASTTGSTAGTTAMTQASTSSSGTTADSASNATGSTDSSGTSRNRATPQIEFGPATPVPGVNSAVTDDDPTVSSDQLEMFFCTQRGETEDIYLSTRNSIGDDWSMPVAVAQLQSAETETSVKLLGDDNTLVFSRSTTDADLEFFISTRAGPGAAWTSPQMLSEFNTSSEDHAMVSVKGDQVRYWCSNRPDGMSRRLHRAVRDMGGQWGTPVRLDLLPNDDEECNQWVSEDEDILLFVGTDAQERQDLYLAVGEDGDWGQPQLIEVLSTPADEGDPWVVLDEDTGEGTLYFVRDMNGDRDLFMASMTVSY